jgi:Bacterial regulatory protein, Fis family
VQGDYAVAVLPSIERDETLRAWGSRYARLVLERCHGNKREACRILDISYHTLQSYLRYPIHRDVKTDAVEETPGMPVEQSGESTLRSADGEV